MTLLAETPVAPATAPLERAPDRTEQPAAGRGSRLSVVGSGERVLHPKPSGKPDPTGHLTAEQVEALGRELDALRQEVIDSRGARDAAYIRKVIKANRYLELGSRAVLLFSGFPPAWLLGTAGLSIAKIVDNMEIGHNIMHGQWDWMRDPKIHSTTWEWDNVSPSSQWKKSHNETHHTYTNVIGHDDDLGYGLFRVDDDQPWTLGSLGQPLYSFINAVFFEYGIASYDLKLRGILKGEREPQEYKPELAEFLRKIRRQVGRDYVLHPLLSGPNFLTTLGANVVANIVRNVWTNSIILCGHFPYGVETFATDSIEGETRGEWYVRQMLGSGNISGSRVIHFMSGNLSHQIEHHIFPDLPSNRYIEIAPRVREICERYDLKYVTGSFPHQLASAWAKIIILALPNKSPDRSRASVVREAAAAAAGRKVEKVRARLAARQAQRQGA